MNNVVQIDSPVAMKMSNLLTKQLIPPETLKASGIIKIAGPSADDIKYRLEVEPKFTLEFRTDHVIAEISLDYNPTKEQMRALFDKYVKPTYPELELI